MGVPPAGWEFIMKGIRFFYTLITSLVLILVLNSAAQVTVKKFPIGLEVPIAFKADVEFEGAVTVIPSENQTGCSVVIRLNTPDGDGFIEGIKVVVENRTTNEKYEQLTDNLGKASFLGDPATNQLFITKLVLMPKKTKYIFDSGVIKPANAVIEYFIIPNMKNDRVTDQKFQVNLKFSKMNITTSLETGNSLKNIDANVYIRNGDTAVEQARASGGKATFYLPAGTDEVRESKDGIRISKINIGADYDDPVDKLRKEAAKSETFPPAAWDHQLVLTDFDSWFDATKVEMYGLLKDVSSEDIAKEVNKVGYKYGDKSAFNKGIIELTDNFRRNITQDSESLFHEWTHAIMDMGYGAYERGDRHEVPCATMKDTNWAWSEGRAHFSAILLTEILNKPHTDSYTRKIALNCPQMLSDSGTPGEDIETVVAAAMLEYYRKQYGKLFRPVHLRKFLSVHQGTEHKTVNEFFDRARSLVRGSKEADLTEQIQILYRLTLAPEDFFKVKIKGDTIGTEGSVTDLSADLRTRNGLPLFEGFEDKIQIEWSENGKSLGKGFSLQFQGVSGEHNVKAEVFGKITEKDEKLAEETIKITVLPKLSLQFNGPTEVMRDDRVTVEAVSIGSDGKPASLKSEFKPVYFWSVFKPGDYSRNPISFSAPDAKDLDIPVELRMEVDGKSVVVATGIYHVKVNSDKPTPTPTPTPKPTPILTPAPSPTPGGQTGDSSTLMFGGSVPSIWDGGNNPSGFAFKRQTATMKNVGDCTIHPATVGSEIWGRIDPSFAPRNQEEITKKVSEVVAAWKGWHRTSVVRQIAIGDFRGQFVDSSVDFYPGSGAQDSGYPADGVSAKGRGWFIKGQNLVEIGYNVFGGGCFSNVDQPFLISQANSAQAEAKGIVASLTLVEKGGFTKIPYTGPKLDGSDVPKVTLSPPSLEKLKVGDTVNVSVVVENATPDDSPFKYTWGGEFEGKPETSKDKATITIKPKKPGKYPLSVSVNGARFHLGSASLEYEVADLKAEIKQESPTSKKVAVGTPVTFSARLLSSGVPLTGNFIYLWQPTPEVAFDPIESAKNTTIGTFSRPGVTKVWVEVLEKKGTVLTPLAKSDQIEVEAVNPELAIKFDPAKVFIGKEVKARVEVTPAELKDIDFRWEISANGRQTMESPDKRQITFIPQNAAPVTVTARARVKFNGDDVGEKSATITADKYDVKVIILGAEGPKPQVWKKGFGLVPLEKDLAVHQFVGIRAEVLPVADGIRYEWTVNEDTHFESNSITQQIRVSRSQVGTGEATVIVRDKNGLELGRAGNSFSVTVSQAELDNSKKIGDVSGKLTQAEDLIKKGKLDEAIILADEIISVDPTNTQALSFLQKTKSDVAKIHAQLEKYRTFAKDSRFREAQAELIVAQNITGVYQPVADAVRELRDLWWKYDAAVKERLDAMQLANEHRQFKKTLELADQTRGELRLSEMGLQNFNRLEQFAKTHDAEKDRQRSIMKRGEEKLGNYDFAGAYQDFNVMHANNDFAEYWNSNYDPEPPIYDKLRSDTYLTMESIKLLLANASIVANDVSFATPIVEKAIKDCDEVLKLQPNNADAQNFKTILADRLTQGEKRLEFSDAMARAIALQDEKKYDEAISEFNKAIKAEPNSAEAYRRRGVSKRLSDDVRGALRDFDKAILLDPTNNLTYFGRGLVYQNEGKFDLAIADYTNALAINPQYASAYYNRGTAYQGQEKYELAIADYSSTIAINPRHAKAYSNRGSSYEIQGKYDLAIDDYEKAITIDPNDEETKNLLANLRAKLAAETQPPTNAFGLISGQYDVKGLFSMILTVNGNTFWGYETSGGIEHRDLSITNGIISGDEISFHRTLPGYPGGQDYQGKIQGNKIVGTFTGAGGAPGQQYPWELDLTPVTAAKPTGTETVIFTNTNTGGVYNGPTGPTEFTISRPHMITYLFTYHWNDGRGSTVPGTIALKHSDETVYGPYPVRGTAGQGGVKNAVWEANPNVLIPAGSYTIVDSNPATWSQNDESSGRGFAIIKGYPSSAASTTRPQVISPRLSLLQTGRYSITANTMQFEVSLTVSGSTFSGYYVSGSGTFESREYSITNGIIAGDTVTFHRTSLKLGPWRQIYKGRIQGNKIVGTFTDADGQQYPWELDLTPKP